MFRCLIVCVHMAFSYDHFQCPFRAEIRFALHLIYTKRSLTPSTADALPHMLPQAKERKKDESAIYLPASVRLSSQHLVVSEGASLSTLSATVEQSACPSVPLIPTLNLPRFTDGLFHERNYGQVQASERVQQQERQGKRGRAPSVCLS